jgi:hypothetical protein
MGNVDERTTWLMSVVGMVATGLPITFGSKEQSEEEDGEAGSVLTAMHPFMSIIWDDNIDGRTVRDAAVTAVTVMPRVFINVGNKVWVIQQRHLLHNAYYIVNIEEFSRKSQAYLKVIWEVQ